MHYRYRFKHFSDLHVCFASNRNLWNLFTLEISARSFLGSIVNNNYLGNEKLILKQRNSPSADLIHQRQLIMHVVLGFVLLSVIVVVISFYVDHEHTIYISDYVGYQNITHNIVAQYHHSPWNALYAIALSTTAEYNAIFTIPLLPWMLSLGESRM